MIFQAIENKKNPGVSKFVSDKIDFKTKAITRQRRNFKYNRQDMKTIYMSIERWMDNEEVVHANNGILLAKKEWNLERKDGGRVNGSHTDLLPGPIWNYNSIVEKLPGINNWAIAREKPYNFRLTEKPALVQPDW